MNSPKRILDQLEHGRSVPRPLATQSSRRHLVYALGVAGMVAVLSAGVVGWGTDSAPHAVAKTDTVFKAAVKAAPRSGQEDQRMAAAIVNEPLQHHVAAQTRTVSATAAGAAGASISGKAAGVSPVKATGTPRTGQAVRTARTHAAPRADSDIALLTALVTHANANANAKTGEDGHSGDATGNLPAQQLRQCERLSGNEAAQCHARACTDRWGRDSACRITTSE